jgi:hypothetical protein
MNDELTVAVGLVTAYGTGGLVASRALSCAGRLSTLSSEL